MSETPELKPCPFCNGRPTMNRIIREYEAGPDGPAGEYEAHHEIHCDECGFSIGEEYRGDAVRDWNRRAGRYAPEGTFSERLAQAMAALDEPLPMEVELWAAGADQDTAEFVARMLAQQGYALAKATGGSHDKE